LTEPDDVALLRQGTAAWNAWREANPSIHPDLREANLNGANLSGAMLHDADLSKTVLSRTNLTGANLSGANLGGAYLSGAVLSEANLRGADLKGAILIGTNIKGANLSLADFSGANFSNADLTNTDLSGATLNGANLRLSNLSSAELTGVRWQLRTMRGCYLGVRGLDSSFGNALFKRAAADQDFLDTFEAHLQGSRGMALFRVWGLIDYGRSLFRVAAVSFGLAFIYGAISNFSSHS
jgi:uncharacterized protein YjbI with pentapeptide repeats